MLGRFPSLRRCAVPQCETLVEPHRGLCTPHRRRIDEIRPPKRKKKEKR